MSLRLLRLFPSQIHPSAQPRHYLLKEAIPDSQPDSEAPPLSHTVPQESPITAPPGFSSHWSASPQAMVEAMGLIPYPLCLADSRNICQMNEGSPRPTPSPHPLPQALVRIHAHPGMPCGLPLMPRGPHKACLCVSSEPGRSPNPRLHSRPPSEVKAGTGITASVLPCPPHQSRALRATQTKARAGVPLTQHYTAGHERATFYHFHQVGGGWPILQKKSSEAEPQDHRAT